MNVEQADIWYFAFRQILPKPPAKWRAQGPFSSYKRATAEREAAKAYDAEVGNVFSANSKDEAQEKCDAGTTP